MELLRWWINAVCCVDFWYDVWWVWSRFKWKFPLYIYLAEIIWAYVSFCHSVRINISFNNWNLPKEQAYKILCAGVKEWFCTKICYQGWLCQKLSQLSFGELYLLTCHQWPKVISNIALVIPSIFKTFFSIVHDICS